MLTRCEVSRLERQAERLQRQLIAIIDEREPGAGGLYIALGSVSPEFEALSREELAELQAKHGEALLVVRVGDPRV